MVDRTVSVSLVADMSNYLAGMTRGSAATTSLGKQAQSTGELTRAFVSKVGSSIQSLGNQVGGTVGAVLDTVGSGIDKVAEKGAHLSTAFEVGGGAAVAAGLGLQQLGSAAVEATDKLNQAITNNGESASEYAKKIDDAVSSAENFGFAAEDTKTALTTLATATGSTQKALDNMNVVTDLAAAKHESLADAATAVSRVLAGNAGRTLSQYGITMDGVGTKTQQGQKAIDELSQKLNGQAAASVDNFAGHVKVATTEVSDFIQDAAQPAGVTLTALGGTATAVGLIWDIYKDHAAKATAAQVALNASTAAAAAPLDAEGASATAAGTSLKGMSVLGTASAIAGATALAGAALYGASSLGTLTDAAQNNTIVFKNANDAAAAYAKQVSLVNTVIGGTDTQKRAAALANVSGAAGTFGKFFAGSDLTSGLDQQYQSSSATITKIDSSLASLVAGGHVKEAAAEYTKWTDAAKKFGISTSDLEQAFPVYLTALSNYSGATGTAAAKTTTLGASFSTASFNASALKTSTSDLETALSKYGSSAQSAESATEQYYSALSDANTAIKENGKNTNDATAKGRANNQALYSLADAANAVAEANLKNKQPLADVQAQLGTARTQFIQTAEAMGYSQTAAQNLAQTLISTGQFKYNFNLDGVTVATNSIDTYIKELNKIPSSISTSVLVHGTGTSGVGPIYIKHAGGEIAPVAHFADGGGYGQYRGPGSGTSDKILAAVSNGEYISKASTVARVGVPYFQYLNRGGSPFAATYQPAPSVGANITHVNVTVPITSSLIGDTDYVAKGIATTVKNGLKSGVIPSNWNSN